MYVLMCGVFTVPSIVLSASSCANRICASSVQKNVKYSFSSNLSTFLRILCARKCAGSCNFFANPDCKVLFFTFFCLSTSCDVRNDLWECGRLVRPVRQVLVAGIPCGQVRENQGTPVTQGARACARTHARPHTHTLVRTHTHAHAAREKPE
jgi:hypothetical protein